MGAQTRGTITDALVPRAALRPAGQGRALCHFLPRFQAGADMRSTGTSQRPGVNLDADLGQYSKPFDTDASCPPNKPLLRTVPGGVHYRYGVGEYCSVAWTRITHMFWRIQRTAGRRMTM